MENVYVSRNAMSFYQLHIWYDLPLAQDKELPICTRVQFVMHVGGQAVPPVLHISLTFRNHSHLSQGQYELHILERRAHSHKVKNKISLIL